MKCLRLAAVIISAAITLSAGAQSLWNRSHLENLKRDIKQSCYAESFRNLLAEADSALNCRPLSVMDKFKAPASGDKHDYMSQARYAWADPTKPDGLPYIMRDGESNPELERLDRVPLSTTTGRISNLALAYYLTGAEKYAAKAAELIRVWFLDPETCMNPNLEYAQVFPGHNGDKGRSYGLIDSYSFIDMVNAVPLLEGSASFDTADSEALKDWFRAFTRWMLTSEQGREEDAGANNHSVAYDAQIIAYALYTGDNETAERVIAAFPKRRMYRQIDPDGRQPHELTRTRAFHYSWYNLTHFVDIMLMAKNMGKDISNVSSFDGRNLYRALDFLIPYIVYGKEVWPYQEIGDWDEVVQNLVRDLYRTGAYLAPERKDYIKIYNEYGKYRPGELFNLLYLDNCNTAE